MRRIGVLTSGGDCPGLNAVLRGVVSAATNLEWEVIGFLDGYEGLLDPSHYTVLSRKETDSIMPMGGTILGTTNKGHFVAKVGHGEKAVLAPNVVEQTKKTLEELHVDGLICIGGDGSLTTAYQLYQAGINTIGVPKTIDNDIEATAITFGFDSAVACVVDALDRLHTTASSHKRIIVLEVMGRYAGWIALYGGLAGDADIILIPEIPFSYDVMECVIRDRERQGDKATLVVVAEGAHESAGGYITREDSGSTGEHKLGGIAEQVAARIHEMTGKETRSVVLGHLQRGGQPTALDRILGTRFGVGAVELIREGKYGRMVSYQNYLVDSVPMAEAVNRLKTVSPDCQFVQMAREVGISFCDPS